MISTATAHFLGSKTYVLLLVFAVIALITCVVAASIFGRDLWDRFFDLLMGETAAGATRAVAVDGAPKVAAAFKDPNSQAANPPSATLGAVTHTTTFYDIDSLYR